MMASSSAASRRRRASGLRTTPASQPLRVPFGPQTGFTRPMTTAAQADPIRAGLTAQDGSAPEADVTALIDALNKAGLTLGPDDAKAVAQLGAADPDAVNAVADWVTRAAAGKP